jgi:DNA-binding beta-propeller fold protein YncE
MPIDQQILSNGAFRYEVVEDWAQLPAEFELGDVAAVGVDRRDQVFLFTRGEHPMIVLDREGNVLRTWGHGLFSHPHGLHIGPDDTVYCTDDGDHTVRQFTASGKLLIQIGIPGKPAPLMSGLPFHACTHTAHSPQGDLYVTDGYGNACVHKFAPDGRHLKTWGRSGCGPGEFYFPHNVVCDAAGWIYVADRENHRIQVFDEDGRYQAQWNNLHRPCALCSSGGDSPLFFIGEMGPAVAVGQALSFPNLGSRIVVLDGEGNQLARLSGGPAGIGPRRFVAAHGIAVDSYGDLYVSEVANTTWSAFFPDVARPRKIPTLHKLRRLK